MKSIIIIYKIQLRKVNIIKIFDTTVINNFVIILR